MAPNPPLSSPPPIATLDLDQASPTVKSEHMEEFDQLLPTPSPPAQPVAPSSRPTRRRRVTRRRPSPQRSSSHFRSPSADNDDKEHLVQPDGLILPSGFLRQLYGVDFENHLAGARAYACSACVDNDHPCEQSNALSWRCKRCVRLGLMYCEWEIKTRMCS